MPEKEESQPNMQDLVNSLNARLRLSEERQAELRRKFQLMEQNMLQTAKKQGQELRLIREDITSSKQTMRNIEERIVTIIKELQLTPKKEDVDLVKKYMEYWNPVQFVTVDKIDDFVKDALNRVNETAERD